MRGVSYTFANVISNELEDGSFTYDVRYRTHQDNPWALLHCASARDAAELADRLNDLAVGVTVFSPQQRLRIRDSGQFTLMVLCEGDPQAGIPRQSFELELPELTEQHERVYFRHHLAKMFSDMLGERRISTIYSDEQDVPQAYVPRSDADKLTGQQLYERHCTLAANNGVIMAKWDDLSSNERATWIDLAAHLEDIGQV